MLIGGDDIGNDVITLGTCFSMFVYILAHYFPLFADSQKSDSSVNRKPQGNWRWNLNSRHVVQALPSFPAPPPECPQSLLSGYCITVFSVTPITGVQLTGSKYENTLQLLLLLLLTPYLILTSIGGDKVLLLGDTWCTWTCEECRKLWTSLNVGP